VTELAGLPFYNKDFAFTNQFKLTNQKMFGNETICVMNNSFMMTAGKSLLNSPIEIIPSFFLKFNLQLSLEEQRITLLLS
jgi:hypothetical protein